MREAGREKHVLHLRVQKEVWGKGRALEGEQTEHSRTCQDGKSWLSMKLRGGLALDSPVPASAIDLHYQACP